MIPDNFCIVPWIHLSTEPTGAIKPCCMFDARSHSYDFNLKTHSLEQVWNHDSQKNIRKQLLNNQVPIGCKTCSLRDKSGTDSYKTYMNTEFKKHIIPAIENTKPDGHYDKFELLYWDFRVSNFCNFKCRMCGFDFSSSYYDETVSAQVNNLPKILDSSLYDRDLMKYVDQFIDVVEEVYFAGGEPLIIAEHYQILDKLIEKERFDVKLRYSTNLSTLDYKSYDVISAWKKFKNVTVSPSLDGMGIVAEYNRHGTKWPKIESNLIRLMESGVNTAVSCLVNVYTVFGLPKFIDKLISLNYNLNNLIVTVLTDPKCLSISILNDNLKQQIKTSYDQHLNTLSIENRKIVEKSYNQICFYLNLEAVKEDQIDFYDTTMRKDRFRNENILDVVPEYTGWLVDLRRESHLRKLKIGATRN